jgi:acetyl-CoA decarbonylase/synthase complex subunit gamma
VGNLLTLDMVAVRSLSDDPARLAACVKKVSENTDYPLILISLNPEVLRAGLDVVNSKPLIYAANENNWKEVAELAKEYNVPVTISAPGDLDLLKSLAKTFLESGLDELVLDPGTYPVGKQLEQTLANFAQLRRAGIMEDNKDVAFPLMSIPMTAWMAEDDPVDATYLESIIANIFIVKYGDIMILHSMEPYSMMPLMMLDENIYTDPRRPVQVDSGVIVGGEPDRNAPVLITTNFALTYYTVESDFNALDVSGYYTIVADTDGIGVEASVAGGQLKSSTIKKAMDSSEINLEEAVDHKTLILPGLAARLQGDLEDETGWKVMVGPQDSGQLAGWMVKNWPAK